MDVPDQGSGLPAPEVALTVQPDGTRDAGDGVAGHAGGSPRYGRLGGGGGGGAPAASPGPLEGSPRHEGQVKRLIFAMKTAGPAFLQRQLEPQPRSAPAGVAPGRAGGAGSAPPLAHALTESPAVIKQYAQ